MKLVGVGANLPSVWGRPRDACGAAVRTLATRGVVIKQTSRWWETEPLPLSNQPWYVNGVVLIETHLSAQNLLDLLHEVEHIMGRTRQYRNAARVIDLDLIAYDDLITSPKDIAVTIPHPRCHERAFVLKPLQDVAPQWRHPLTGKSISELLTPVVSNQMARPLPPEDISGS